MKRMESERRRSSALPWGALIALVATLGAIPSAHAQGPVRDDVQWEVRRTPYGGGPIRPGAELDGSPSALTWIGASTLIGGYALSLLGIAGEREYAAIPLVGPWLAAFGVLGGAQWEGAELSALMVLSGIAQPAGAVLLTIGVLNPDLYIVYDAPVGAPSPFETARVSILPSAPGADVGVSLAVETF